MQISSIHPEELASWEAFQDSLLAFVQKYGQRGVAPGVYKKIQRLTPRQLERPGTGIFMATVQAEDGKRTAGILCAADFGKELCAAVVHPLYRGRGTGTRLLQTLLSDWGELECRVAARNTPALKMCFHAGLTAFDAEVSGAGKPELLLSNKLPFKEGDYFAAARAGDSYVIHEQ